MGEMHCFEICSLKLDILIQVEDEKVICVRFGEYERRSSD